VTDPDSSTTRRSSGTRIEPHESADRTRPQQPDRCAVDGAEQAALWHPRHAVAGKSGTARPMAASTSPTGTRSSTGLASAGLPVDVQGSE
jgi:hypothetical protein